MHNRLQETLMRARAKSNQYWELDASAGRLHMKFYHVYDAAPEFVPGVTTYYANQGNPSLNDDSVSAHTAANATAFNTLKTTYSMLYTRREDLPITWITPDGAVTVAHEIDREIPGGTVLVLCDDFTQKGVNMRLEGNTCRLRYEVDAIPPMHGTMIMRGGTGRLVDWLAHAE